MTDLTFAILKYGFLILLWLFVWLVVRSLYRDISALAPKSSGRKRHKGRHGRGTSASVGAQAGFDSANGVYTENSTHGSNSAHSAPTPRSTATLLTIIDGPLSGTTLPLGTQSITLGRAPGNTVVLDDEFVSSHHARVYMDPISRTWAVEDLASTNGTVLNGSRISGASPLPIGVPVRIGATTFELR